MPRVGDILLPLWCIYVTFMTIVGWFSGSVDSFEDWLISVMAWYFMIIIGFAVRGRD